MSLLMVLSVALCLKCIAGLYKAQNRVIAGNIKRDSPLTVAHLSVSDTLSPVELKALSTIETYSANRMAQKI